MPADSESAKVAIFVGVKGRGSNMVAIARACHNHTIHAEVRAVIGQMDSAPAIERARELGLPVKVISSKEPDYGAVLASVLIEAKIDIVCLAGYMRMLPPEVLDAFPGRVLNIHPALLPKFGGQGMYGSHVHEAVLASGESESGCTVHVVTNVYDDGEVILQRKCAVDPHDTVETLAARVIEQEHLAYPEAIEIVWNRTHHQKA